MRWVALLLCGVRCGEKKLGRVTARPGESVSVNEKNERTKNGVTRRRILGVLLDVALFATLLRPALSMFVVRYDAALRRRDMYMSVAGQAEARRRSRPARTSTGRPASGNEWIHSWWRGWERKGPSAGYERASGRFAKVCGWACLGSDGRHEASFARSDESGLPCIFANRRSS